MAIPLASSGGMTVPMEYKRIVSEIDEQTSTKIIPTLVQQICRRISKIIFLDPTKFGATTLPQKILLRAKGFICFR